MYVPFPVEPVSVNVVAVNPAMVHVPLAAVLPSTPLMVTRSPLVRPVVSTAVMVMGLVLLAPVSFVELKRTPVAGVGIIAVCVQVSVFGLKISDVPVNGWGVVYSPPMVKTRPSCKTTEVLKRRCSAGVNHVPDGANEVHAPFT